MNSEGGNHAGSNSDIPRDSPREAQTEGKLEQLSKKTDKLCRSESSAGSESFNEQYVAKLDEQKAPRNLSAGEQLQRNGKVELGIITKGFRQGIGIYDGDKPIVPERTPHEISKLEDMQTASDQGLLIGAGGKFVAKQSYPTDTMNAHQLIDPETGNIRIGRHTYSSDQIIAQLPGRYSDASAQRTAKHEFVTVDQDEAHPLGSRTYIKRTDGTLDKFDSSGKYLGTAVDSATGKIYHNQAAYQLNAVNQIGDISAIAGHSIKFVNQNAPERQPQYGGTSNGQQAEQSARESKPLSNSQNGRANSELKPLTPTTDSSGGLENTPSSTIGTDGMLHGGVNDKEQAILKGYADSNGNVPFGDGDPGTPLYRGKTSNDGYYTYTLGVDSMSGSDVININIGDNIQVAGANIRDRQPHRHTFPIKTSAGNTHWHWIDATVQMSTDGRGLKLQIHGLSADSPEDPSKTASHKWTPVNLQFDLWRNSQTQHIPAREFHDFVLPSGEQRLRRQNEPSWTSHPEKYNRISVNEKL